MGALVAGEECGGKGQGSYSCCGSRAGEGNASLEFLEQCLEW